MDSYTYPTTADEDGYAYQRVMYRISSKRFMNILDRVSQQTKNNYREAYRYIAGDDNSILTILLRTRTPVWIRVSSA